LNSIVEYNTELKTYLNPQSKLSAFKYLFLFLTVLWCAGFMLPVLPDFSGKPIVHQLLKYNYSLVCHQSESASIYLGNDQLLVCARCSGIYAGALLILLLALIKSFSIKYSLKPLFLFSAPLAIDALAIRLGIYSYSKIIALISGFLFGAVLIFYVLDSVKNSFHLLNKNI